MMERVDEEGQRQESSRGGIGQTRRTGEERSQTAREQGERPQGRSSQKPQENFGRQAQCPPATAWTPQRLNLLIEIIRARFGDYAIGRGNSGIRFHTLDRA
jgi:hypothetical protein